jgi:hypothetical protein
MNSQTQRRPQPPEGELVSPLSGPDYGSRTFAQAKRSWRNKPLDVLVAATLAHNLALLKRLEGQLYSPPREVNHNTPKMAYDFLYKTVHEQIMALKVFSDFDWSEING